MLRTWSLAAAHEPAHVFAPGTIGRALELPARDITSLILDLDSSIFELNSACELTMQLVQRLLRHVGHDAKRSDAGRFLCDSLEATGEQPVWLEVLKHHRNHFIHNAAPYLIVDLSAPWGSGHDILIMRHGTNDLSDPQNFLRLSDLDAVVQSFQRAMPALQGALVALLASARTSMTTSTWTPRIAGSTAASGD